MPATRDEMMTFAKEIERLVREKELNHIEAITHYCSVVGMEVEAATKLINGPLRAKITNEAIDLNLIKSSHKRLL